MLSSLDSLLDQSSPVPCDKCYFASWATAAQCLLMHGLKNQTLFEWRWDKMLICIHPWYLQSVSNRKCKFTTLNVGYLCIKVSPPLLDLSHHPPTDLDANCSAPFPMYIMCSSCFHGSVARLLSYFRWFSTPFLCLTLLLVRFCHSLHIFITLT